MKNQILLLLTLGALVSCGAQEEKKSSDLKNVPEGESRVLCSTDGLPKDWVTVGHTNSVNCRSARDWNAYVVKKAGPKETVCSDSNIPAGYVKVHMLNTGNCGISFNNNAIYIEKL